MRRWVGTPGLLEAPSWAVSFVGGTRAGRGWAPSMLPAPWPNPFSERSSAEGGGYVVAAVIEAMGDECMDVIGHGHSSCVVFVEAQLGHRLAIAGVNREPGGLVGEKPDHLDVVWQRDRGDRVLALIEQHETLQNCFESGRGQSRVLPMLADDLGATYDLGASLRASAIRVIVSVGA